MNMHVIPVFFFYVFATEPAFFFFFFFFSLMSMIDTFMLSLPFSVVISFAVQVGFSRRMDVTLNGRRRRVKWSQVDCISFS